MSFLKSVLGVSENDVKDLEDCAAAFGQESIGEAYIDYNHEVQQGTLIPTLMYIVMSAAIESAFYEDGDTNGDAQWTDHYEIDSNYSMWGITSLRTGDSINDMDTLKADCKELQDSIVDLA